MPKLYPPILAGTLPAFYLDSAKSTVAVPFQMNRAVSFSEISGFKLKIKTVQNSRLIGNTIFYSYNENQGNITEIPFDFSTVRENLNVGQFYKLQIAYVDMSGVVGHYSSVGVIKYTNKPEINIAGTDKKILSNEGNNVHCYTYFGIYKNLDSSEKLYQYAFNFYDNTNKLASTTGWQLYNNINNPNTNESICQFTLNKDLREGERYFIEFEAITANNLYIKTPKYYLIQKKSILPNVDFKVHVDGTTLIEDGGIRIFLKDDLNSNINEKLYTGSFKLLRSDETTEFSEWNEILAFKLFDQVAPEVLFDDYTIKQGIQYKYAIVQYNDYGMQSNKIESKIVVSNFEYIYLFDGEKQLKIKYNPKISSFKEVKLESKIDTIGSKHPFIFRNGVVGYKEFPISGLISLLADENILFFKSNLSSPIQHREYIDIYKEVEVRNKITYYYQKDWDKLYCASKRGSKTWRSVREWCKMQKIEIKDGFNPTLLDYAIKVSDPKPGESPYEIVLVENIKTYYYPNIKNDLYTLFAGKYSLIDSNQPYNDKTKYYLKRVKTKNVYNELDSFRFSNYYSMEAIQSERDFKLEVLDWLNNGKAKLFRSPTEGNYIVRLMNSSLAPNDQLGRVLHTFTSTAYEVEECTFDNLIKNNFMQSEDPTIQSIRWETIQLDKTGKGNHENLLNYQAIALRFEGMIPGDQVHIDDGIVRNGESGFTVVIGYTGSYNIELEDGMRISSVTFKGSSDNIDEGDMKVTHQGQLTYAFETTTFTSFDQIEDFEVVSIPLRQFYGKTDNVFDKINDIKNQLQQIYFIHAMLRDQLDVYAQYNNEGIITHYTQGLRGKTLFEGSEIDTTQLDRYYLYRVFTKENGEYKATKYYDGYSYSEIRLNDQDIKYGDKIIINKNAEIQVFRDNDFFLKECEDINSLYMGYCVLLEVCYQSTVTKYRSEDEKIDNSESAQKVLDAKNLYNNAVEQYKKDTGASAYLTYLKEQEIETLYNNFIKLLEYELERQGGIEGELI